MRFLRDGEGAVAGVPKCVADVVVEMLGDLAPRGDGMNVEVEDFPSDRFQGSETGLFIGFLQRYGEDVGVAVGVTSGLDPDVEFAVVSEQRGIALGIHDPGGAGDVAAQQRSLEAVLVLANEGEKTSGCLGFLRMVRGVGFEGDEQRLAMHGFAPDLGVIGAGVKRLGRSLRCDRVAACPNSDAELPMPRTSTAEKIATRFQVPGRLVALQPISTGNVNDTYRAIFRTTFSEEQFILQRINKTVFKDPVAVMANMKAVTDHAHCKIEAEAEDADRIWQLPRVISADDGLDYAVDGEGEYWRALSLIASARSYESLNTPEHAVEAGVVLGHFQRIISDFPADDLKDTLPGFHITPTYLAQYDETLRNPEARQRLDHSSEARRLAKFVEERREFASVLEDARERGELQLRPIHGDPKITNIMLDNFTGKGTCIVDLDTVKPGLIHYDFGDCARSSCNPAGEESTDLSEVFLDVDLFAALVKGYLREAKAFLSEADRYYLYDSVRLIAFELGLRFFADYLAGDVYFKVNYDGHNLNRARVQLALCESIEARESKMRRALE